MARLPVVFFVSRKGHRPRVLVVFGQALPFYRGLGRRGSADSLCRKNGVRMKRSIENQGKIAF